MQLCNFENQQRKTSKSLFNLQFYLFILQIIIYLYVIHKLRLQILIKKYNCNFIYIDSGIRSEWNLIDFDPKSIFNGFTLSLSLKPFNVIFIYIWFSHFNVNIVNRIFVIFLLTFVVLFKYFAICCFLIWIYHLCELFILFFIGLILKFIQ